MSYATILFPYFLYFLYIKYTLFSNIGKNISSLAHPIRSVAMTLFGELFYLSLTFAHTHLTLQEQTIFRMRFLDAKSYEEIGAALGISRVAVWKHLSHLMTTIKGQFDISEP